MVSDLDTVYKLFKMKDRLTVSRKLLRQVLFLSEDLERNWPIRDQYCEARLRKNNIIADKKRRILNF